MITKDEIKVLLKDIENERVERTISTKDTDKFARAVCAFANDLPNKRPAQQTTSGLSHYRSLR